ncbi:MAG TPA: UDP-N-acetylglucosamine--N-acetylmuramyl-(pentapeptide) pyrophosphoryl-undecaprenol N-acetylglucosamine transferase [Victivallales bacterium]|nr:UDP-N-acetylglucosamine--N-acetylmuramyl-(pentapeptide) pyrophosphoryl-undecaprenol N-acetylglucosamine transferase [Victivallales bacterium]
MNKIAIACGGTGGHFYPGLSVAVEFKKLGGTPLLILSGKHSEEQKLKALELDIESEIIPSPPVPTGILEKIDYSKTCAINIMKIIKIFSSFKPDALLVMGSYTSIAAGIASTISKVPMVIHEGNSLAGKANLFLSRFASKMALSFPAVNSRKIVCKYEITGMPVRNDLIQKRAESKKDAISQINSIYGVNFSPFQPLILVFGGSQGAMKINDLVPPAFEMQKNKNFQVIHIAGSGKAAETNEKYAAVNLPKLILGTSDKMSLMYAASDLVICRSGGSTLAELALFGKYAILAPYPYASDNHQRDNAEYYASSGAGTVLNDTDFTITRISALINSFLENPSEYQEKGKLSNKIAAPDAASKIINLIRESVLSKPA